MATFSAKKGGKEVGSADVYAPPHNMEGKAGTDLSNNGYGANPQRVELSDMAVSVGAARSKPYPDVKTTGIKMRGVGCATKGTMSRGPMA
jgi:hypothetical protein